MRRKQLCLAVGLLFAVTCLVGCGTNKGTSPSPSPSASPMATTSGVPLAPPGVTVTPEQAAQVIGETPEKVFMKNELQGTVAGGKVFAIALPEETGVTWQVTADDGVEELPDGMINVKEMASDGQGGVSPSPAGISPSASPLQSPTGSPAASPSQSPAGSPEASPSPAGSPSAEGNYHVWGFKIADAGQYNIRISDTNNAAAETTFTITVKASSWKGESVVDGEYIGATLDTMRIRVNGEDKVFYAPEALELKFGLTPGDRVRITLVRTQQDAFIDRVEKVD